MRADVDSVSLAGVALPILDAGVERVALAAVATVALRAYGGVGGDFVSACDLVLLGRSGGGRPPRGWYGRRFGVSLATGLSSPSDSPWGLG
jgi:hypothetical protein